MAQLATPTITTRQFTYSPDSQVLSAEASTLGPEFRTGRVFDDACDEGFTLVSHRTGRRIPLALYTEHHDRDGDLTHWEFRPVRPHAAIRAVYIWND